MNTKHVLIVFRSGYIYQISLSSSPSLHRLFGEASGNTYEDRYLTLVLDSTRMFFQKSILKCFQVLPSFICGSMGFDAWNMTKPCNSNTGSPPRSAGRIRSFRKV